MSEAEILDAYALEPGKVYALRVVGDLSANAVSRIVAILREEEVRLGCKFLLLSDALELVPVPPGVSADVSAH